MSEKRQSTSSSTSFYRESLNPEALLEQEKEMEKQQQREINHFIKIWETSVSEEHYHSIIIETASKGTHMTTFINFLAIKKKISLAEAKEYYMKEVSGLP